VSSCHAPSELREPPGRENGRVSGSARRGIADRPSMLGKRSAPFEIRLRCLLKRPSTAAQSGDKSSAASGTVRQDGFTCSHRLYNMDATCDLSN
jgi:hypothetical protein